MSVASGVVTLTSPHTFGDTLARVRAAVASRGLTLFLDLDQQAAAQADGVAMPPAHLVLFGRPRAGTAILLATPEAGVDLPLKIYVWESAEGVVSLSYSDPAWLAARHEIPEAMRPVLAGVMAIAAEAMAVR